MVRYTHGVGESLFITDAQALKPSLLKGLVTLVVLVLNYGCSMITPQTPHLNSTIARLKFKDLGGAFTHRWNMCFNSMTREPPYLSLLSLQALHGRPQSVS